MQRKPIPKRSATSPTPLPAVPVRRLAGLRGLSIPPLEWVFYAKCVFFRYISYGSGVKPVDLVFYDTFHQNCINYKFSLHGCWPEIFTLQRSTQQWAHSRKQIRQCKHTETVLLFQCQCENLFPKIETMSRNVTIVIRVFGWTKKTQIKIDHVYSKWMATFRRLIIGHMKKQVEVVFWLSCWPKMMNLMQNLKLEPLHAQIVSSHMLKPGPTN